MSETSPLLEPDLTRSTATSWDDQSGSPTIRQEAQISATRATVIAFSLFVLIFLCTCNISVLTTIQSPIAIDLNATTETSWFVSTFLIANASVTPIAGKLCQIFSSRVYLLCSTILSAVGLLLTALAPSLAIFLTGRVVYGLGVAAVAPVAIILVTEHATKRRGLLFGLINCGYTTGVACGAIIGGALEPVVGWRACFWLQIPLVLILASTAFFSIPKPSLKDRDHYDSDLSLARKVSRIDFFGIFTMIAAVVLLLFSLSASRLHVTPIVLSVATLALFLLVETSWATDPIVPPAVLRSRGCIFTGLATIGVMSARWGVLFYMPTYGIAVRQWTPEKAGMLLLPTNAGFGLGGLLAGWLHIRRARSYYIPILVCFVLSAVTQFIVGSLAVPNSPIWLFVVVVFSNGFLVGAILNYTLAHLLYVTKMEHHVVVISINTMFRALAGAFGSSISGGIFIRELEKNLEAGFEQADLKNKEELIRQLLGRPLLVQKLVGIEKAIATTSYSSSLRLLYYTGGLLVLAVTVLQAATGWRAPTASSTKHTEGRIGSFQEANPPEEPIGA